MLDRESLKTENLLRQSILSEGVSCQEGKLEFQNEFFLDEVIEGFYVPGMMKRAWAAELQLLSFLDELCKKNGISYFLDYGSLIGAVRHKGFIPWDDDIDISMYRKDFRLLEACIKKDAPEYIDLYYAGKDRETASSLAAIGMKEPSFNPEKQAFFQQFPFYTGLDISILEDILDEKCEKERQKVFYHLASLLKSVEGEKEKGYSFLYEKWKNELRSITNEVVSFLNCYGGELPVIFPEDGKNFIGEIYFAMDSLFRCLENQDTEYVACGPDYALHRKGKMKRSWYKGEDNKTVFLYGKEFTIPSNWDAILKVEYGDYLSSKPNLGDHQYPFYQESEKFFHESLGEKDPYRYFFSKEDLRKQERKNLRAIILESFKALENTWKEASEKNIGKDGLKALCQKSQEEALAIGNAIETRGSLPSVSILEEFCTLLFQLYESLENVTSENSSKGFCDEKEIEEQGIANQEEKLTQIFKTLVLAKTQFSLDWKPRVLFLAYSLERFEKTLEEEFRCLLEEQQLELFLLPVPYGFKNVKGELKERFYEGESFQKKYPILDYKSLNLQSLQADIIVTPTAFDHVNPVFSLDPFYDTKNIKMFTPNLIYYPDFTLDRVGKGEYKAEYNRRYYMPLPGIAFCDYSIFAKEDVVEGYLQYWKENIFPKEDTKSSEILLRKKLISIEKFGACLKGLSRRHIISHLFLSIMEMENPV